jgi:hypothetical protein
MFIAEKEIIVSFIVPDGGPLFTDEIIDRCENLITYGIWGDLHISRLRGWIRNFSGLEERYFAARLLDSLIYRSGDQTAAMIQQLFQRVLPDLFRDSRAPLPAVAEWRDRLKYPDRKRDPGIRFIPVSLISDPTLKSGPVIGRMMKRLMHIDDDAWVIPAWRARDEFESGARVFIFVDDMLATGTQFNEFLMEEKLEELVADAFTVYAPLTAHAEGVNRVRLRFPQLKIAPVETLNYSHCLFHETSDAFADGANTPETAKQFYLDILRSRGLTISKRDSLGFGDLSLSYAFQHAAPNANLPLFWWGQDSAWTPLFDR